MQGKTNRSSLPEVFYKEGVLKDFAKFTLKQLRQSLFFNKVATLLKRRLWHRCFPMNFTKLLRTRFLKEHLRRLLNKKRLKKLKINYTKFLKI